MLNSGHGVDGSRGCRKVEGVFSKLFALSFPVSEVLGMVRWGCSYSDGELEISWGKWSATWNTKVGMLPNYVNWINFLYRQEQKKSVISTTLLWPRQKERINQAKPNHQKYTPGFPERNSWKINIENSNLSSRSKFLIRKNMCFPKYKGAIAFSSSDIATNLMEGGWKIISRTVRMKIQARIRVKIKSVNNESNVRKINNFLYILSQFFHNIRKLISNGRKF